MNTLVGLYDAFVDVRRAENLKHNQKKQHNRIGLGKTMSKEEHEKIEITLSPIKKIVIFECVELPIEEFFKRILLSYL